MFLSKASFYSVILIITLTVSVSGIAQEIKSDVSTKRTVSSFVTAKLGVQMSGIKDEDFISHNRAPLYALGFGKWITRDIALHVGYQGGYFNTIADQYKHHYQFYYGDVWFNVNSLIQKEYRPGHWFVALQVGSGYFYNAYYNKPNVCAVLGLNFSLPLSEKISVTAGISTVMGWDIYQGNDDILPNFACGLQYTL